MILGIKTPDGVQLPAKIIQVTDKEITIDINPPLAGKDLNFKIKVIDISEVADGRLLNVLMNADQEEALAFLE